MMFEVIEGGKKTLLENLQEQARLKKELSAIDQEIAVLDDLCRLVDLAIESKQRSEQGFHVPKELEYAAEAFNQLLEFEMMFAKIVEDKER